MTALARPRPSHTCTVCHRPARISPTWSRLACGHWAMRTARGVVVGTAHLGASTLALARFATLELAHA